MLLQGGVSNDLIPNYDPKGNIYYTDQYGNRVEDKQPLIDALAKKLKAFAINAERRINRPTEEESKRDTNTIIALSTLPLGAGATATKAIATKLTPYVGRRVAKTMAQGIGAGAVGGGVEGIGRGLVEGENPILTGLTGALGGTIFGGLGGLGAGKIAQRLNSQVAWHGSPYKFTKFSNEAIGTGEGAQAHGYGHYAALNKDVAEGYRKKLGGYEYDGKPVLNNSEEDILINKIINDGYNNTLSKYQKDLNDMNEIAKRWEHSPNDYNAVKEIADKLENKINLIKNIDTTKISRGNGQLYKLSVPKNNVMLREGATFAQQPKAVQGGLENYFKDLVELNEGGYQAGKTLVTPGSEEQLLRDYIYNNGDGSSLGIYRGLADRKKTFHELHKDPISSNYAQQQITNDLSDYGIKGISYNGGIDGEARVIFNPDDIDIIPYFDNPKNLAERLLNVINY